MAKLENIEPNEAAEESKEIRSPQLMYVESLIESGAIVATDNKLGYRLNRDILRPQVEDLSQYQTIKIVDEVGEEVELSIPDEEESATRRALRYDFRWLVHEMVDTGTVHADIAFLAGLLCRPANVVAHYSVEKGTDYKWRDGLPLADYLVQEFAYEEGVRIVKDFIVNREPAYFGIRLNMVELVMARGVMFDHLDQALSGFGVEIDEEDKITAILMKALGHEYGHNLTQGKIYDNLLLRIWNNADLDVSTRDERYTNIAKALGGRDKDKMFVDIVNRAYREEENRYFNWVYFKAAKAPEGIGDQSSNQRIKWSGQERISRAMEKVALRSALTWLLRMKGADDSQAGLVAERVAELENSWRQKEMIRFVEVITGQGFTIEVLDRALKEINSSYPECGLHGYSLSKMIGYFYPLTEEELVRVLAPMDLDEKEETAQE